MRNPICRFGCYFFLSLLFCGLYGVSSVAEPSLENMVSVYTSYVNQGASTVQDSPSSWSPSAAFSAQPFVLWDYAEDIAGADPKSDAQHWSDLVQFVKANNITQVITAIKDPSAFPFFSDINPPGQNFVYWAKELPSTCKLQVLFDQTAFSLVAPGNPSPDNNYPGYSSIPNYFLNFPEKMLWTQRMIALGAPIQGVVIDPQNSGGGGGGGNADYQLLIDYMDYYRSQNNLTNLELGITFGIDEHTMTFFNLSTFPVPESLLAIGTPTNFPPVVTPTLLRPEWRSGTTYPLLDNVYIQAYQSDMPYIFTLSSDPTLAASSLLHNFRDEPYLLGLGLISYTQGSTSIAGIGTSFQGISYTNPGSSVPNTVWSVIESMPIGVSMGSQIGIASADAVGSTITTSSPITHPSGANVPFFQTEFVNKWTFPNISPDIANNIYLMFSFEGTTTAQIAEYNTYFGSWTIDQFMQFISSLYSQGQSSLPIYNQKDAAGNTAPIPLPNNFGIYDFYILRQDPNSNLPAP